MKANRLLLASALALLATACASERRTTSSPTPTPSPRPIATATPAPAPASWRDVPLTAGDWRYAPEASGSAALFGVPQAQALLTVRCERPQGTVTLVRPGAAPAAVPVTITTTEGTRAFSALPEPGALPTLVVRLSARDPYLDTLAFSRGRLAVEAAGLPTLYVPSWPEIGRVIEDCR